MPRTSHAFGDLINLVTSPMTPSIPQGKTVITNQYFAPLQQIHVASTSAATHSHGMMCTSNTFLTMSNPYYPFFKTSLTLCIALYMV